MTTAASGTSSSAPVEHGNFQAPLGRYFPLDCGVAFGLSQNKGALGLPRVGEREVGEWGVEFFQQLHIRFSGTRSSRIFLRHSCQQQVSVQIWCHPLGSSPAPTGSPGSCLLRWEGAAVQPAPSRGPAGSAAPR